MPKAILEIDIPESCMECPLAYGVGTINFCSVTDLEWLKQPVKEE